MHYIKMLVWMCKKKLYLFSIFGITLVFLLYWSHNSLINDIDRQARLNTINLLINREASKLACKQPILPIHAPEIMKFLKDSPKIDCSKAGVDWVKCRGSQCVIQEEAKIKYGPIKCGFTDVIRVNDFENTEGDTTYSTEYYKLEKTDVVRVSCKSAEYKWSATLTGIRLDNSIWDRSSWEQMSVDALKMDVLMFGFDSLARNAFIRKLPRSYEYLTKELDAVVLQGYNIVGDGTPQALIPILTGKTELELPDTRKRFKNTQFVNSYPFIWNHFRDSGYVTAFLEDLPYAGTFTYRLNGFQESPTDHYMRTYYLASSGEQHKWPKLCTGDSPRHTIMFNMVKNFFSFYKSKPKFLFGFHGELSHDDYNLIGAADDDFLQLLEDLNNSGALNNTILILMADHGHRFADVRNTMQGKLEERLPFFSFTFPKWFRNQHAHIYRNIKSNEKKLTTPFDIYKTLTEILNLKDTGMADISHRAVSLFSKIPDERSCVHAYIEPHWCACLEWTNINVSNPIAERLAKTFVDMLNNYTSSHRDICEPLSLSQILWVTKLTPNENLIKFNKNADIDGFIADLSGKTEISSDLYQIKAMLKPGDSMFEASIRHTHKSDAMDVKISDISRTNMYGSQARCVEEHLPHLRMFCYCKDTL